LRLGRRRGTAAQRDGFEAGGDHQLQIPFSQNLVRVFPVENFALFGDANFAREITGGLADDGGVGWAPAASHRAAASVEQTELDVAFAGGLMEILLGFVELPGAGEHATVFVRVRVAEHDFLLALPGIEQRLEGWGCPDRAHGG